MYLREDVRMGSCTEFLVYSTLKSWRNESISLRPAGFTHERIANYSVLYVASIEYTDDDEGPADFIT